MRKPNNHIEALAWALVSEPVLCPDWPSLEIFLQKTRDALEPWLTPPARPPLGEPGETRVLFGAGDFGITLCMLLGYLGLSPHFFCDNSSLKQGRHWWGREVISPEELKSIDNVKVIIASSWEEEMRAQLAGLGLKEVYSRADLAWYDCRYLATLADFFLAHREELRAVYGLLSDERSRLVYRNIIKGRLSFNFASYPKFRSVHFPLFSMLSETNQYWALPAFRDIPRAVYADIGAYDGDTVESFLFNNPGPFSRIVAFEPVPELQARLRRKIDELAALFGFDPARVECSNIGLAGGAEPHKTPSLHVGADGRSGDLVEFATTTLDEFFGDSPVDIIKADTEGHEMAILRGAQNLLPAQQPRLAFAIYHKLEDLYEIPLYLHERVPGYKMAVRHHHPSLSCETVLYCWK